MDLSGLASSSDIPAISAFILGLMATMGPCTMATNIAALAYVGRNLTNRTVVTAVLYTLGRMFTYTVLGALIIYAGLSIPGISIFLQDIGEKALGPFLIIIGVLMLFVDKISFGRSGNHLSDLGGKVADWGMIGGLPLGAIFALAFCPYSAVLFFALLLPLALKTAGGVTLPAFFAIGTGLPVLLFGMLLSFGVAGISKWVDAISRSEKIIRISVAIIFICIGIYYTALQVKL
ncbi:MAG: aromatic aminobenezylarsenical efflux permease ArsG family transporter [Dehalococcoidia bacterium]|nr:aromatic aminobenezylarsenical efflux permease ArsG family transporter [Dehalococcoidia bacterium]MDD5493975.1 aromatic aminobenezylarsenical efflux permease ArsG family transporter [Dehalococcoidia bacterium]